MMFERLRSLFVDGRLDSDGLNAAVSRGWITEVQAQEIRDEAST